jgi:glycyl-tRNA synthetase
MAIGEAVATGVVNNETLGYFMARTHMWLEKIGVDPKRMRFRQHLRTEMAHYAADCWDMEIQLSYGWIECVGHADRACYDLDQHSKRTGVPMLAAEMLPAPIEINRVIAEPVKRLLGPKFQKDQKKVIDALESLDNDAVIQLQKDLETVKVGIIEGFEITPDLVVFKNEKKNITEIKYTPSVIEPSYGVGRILYSVLEHSFSQRNGDEQRCVMSFKPCVAPIKVGIYRLLNNAAFTPIINKLRDLLQGSNVTNRIDSSSGSVGRRYARADELGIPFGITIDFQTLIDDTITLRDRDTMSQVRMPIVNLLPIILQLINETITWDWLLSRFQVVRQVGEDDEDEEGESKVQAAKDVNTPTIVEIHARAAFTRPNK